MAGVTAPDAPYWQWSACELADSLAAAEISAEAVMRSTVERMRAVNGQLNAVVDDLGDAAIEQAIELDRTLARSGPVGPLHGVPVTIKINVDQSGCATTNGVLAFRDHIASDDSPIVRNFRRAGAIIVGRTNTPEFSFRGTTDNVLYGRTFNPWNDTASAGGSSGGASSAVMAGMGAIAHGNDIAGSLRYPAAATGAATVKPGLGRLPAFNPSQQAERGMLAQIMSTQGVIAREVRDVRLAMEALIHFDPRDPWMVPMPFEGQPIQGRLRVAMTRNMHGIDLHPAVERALDNARDALTDAGYEVLAVEPPSIREVASDSIRCLFGEVQALMADDVRRHGSAAINRIFDDYFAVFEPFEGKELLQAMARRAHHVRQWLVFLHQYPLVLTPFLPMPTYDWDRDAQGPEGVFEVLGRCLYGHSMNFMGLPAGNVSANLNGGLPVGVQIVGQRFREDLILDACEAIESRVGLMARTLFARQ